MLHNIKYFHKYVTVETALLILENRTLKYSSPAHFNDPFDTQTRFDFDFEPSELMEALTDEFYRLIHDDKEPTSHNEVPLFIDIQAVRKLVTASDKKMPVDVFRRLTAPLVEDTIKWAEWYIKEMNSWWKLLARASKVFCVAENNDNLLMWAHYAKDHTGVVIKFECLPELDTPLCAAKKVVYAKRPPAIAKLNDYIQYLTGQNTHKVKYDKMFYDLFLSKSHHWEYEQEWRVFIPPINMENPIIQKNEKGNELLHYLMPLYPQEIHSIYFGCRMNYDDKQKIENLLIDDFAHVKKYKCKKNEREYKLDFEEMTR